MLPFPVKIYPFEIFTRATPGSSLVFNRTEWNQDRKVHVPEITRFLMLRYHERTQGDPELSKFPFHSINNTAFHPHYNTTCVCVNKASFKPQTVMKMTFFISWREGNCHTTLVINLWYCWQQSIFHLILLLFSWLNVVDCLSS